MYGMEHGGMGASAATDAALSQPSPDAVARPKVRDRGKGRAETTRVRAEVARNTRDAAVLERGPARPSDLRLRSSEAP